MQPQCSSRLVRRLLALALVVGFVLVPTAASAPGDYLGPVFGIDSARDGTLLVADAARGVVGEGGTPLIATLPALNDVAAIRGRQKHGELWAITSPPGPPTNLGGKLLYLIDDGNAVPVADLGAFEFEQNPHPGVLESNPFKVADLGHGKALVADAAGNDVLRVSTRGKIELIAVLPEELVSTSNLKALVGCPGSGAGLCGLPPMIPTEAVPTGIAVGRLGDYYVGELKGFPAPTGESRVWRIRNDAEGVDCATSRKCKVVLDGFTSIIDLAFGPDGRLYVAQIDDASWWAVENDLPGALGGSVHACNLRTQACETIVKGVPVLSSITFREDGSLWGAVNAFAPPPAPTQADVIQLAPAP